MSGVTLKREFLDREREPRRLQALKLELRGDGRIWALVDGEARAVRLRRCFPWTAPGRLITVRDDEDREVALIANVEELEEESRVIAQAALAEADFVFEVREVLDIVDEFEIRHWRVRTRQGLRQFQTGRSDWPRKTPDGSVLIRDVAGDLYRISELATLDEASLRRLSPYVD